VEETSAAAESMTEQANNLKAEMAIFKTTSDYKHPKRQPKLLASEELNPTPKKVAGLPNKTARRSAEPTAQQNNEWSEF
jgi:methyl-accepting chemotaxis protein